MKRWRNESEYSDIFLDRSNNSRTDKHGGGEGGEKSTIEYRNEYILSHVESVNGVSKIRALYV